MPATTPSAVALDRPEPLSGVLGAALGPPLDPRDGVLAAAEQGGRRAEPAGHLPAGVGVEETVGLVGPPEAEPGALAW